MTCCWCMCGDADAEGSPAMRICMRPGADLSRSDAASCKHYCVGGLSLLPVPVSGCSAMICMLFDVELSRNTAQ